MCHLAWMAPESIAPSLCTSSSAKLQERSAPRRAGIEDKSKPGESSTILLCRFPEEPLYPAGQRPLLQGTRALSSRPHGIDVARNKLAKARVAPREALDML